MNSTDETNVPSAGKLLRQGRLRQRLTVADCAKRTHIASRYIEALEEERREELPSESHRVGFLRLYARFLGVPSEEVLILYRQQQGESNGKTVPQAAPGARSKDSSSGWYPTSGLQLVTWGILLLLAAWAIYHALPKSGNESASLSWGRTRSRQPRLVATRPPMSTAQRIRVRAQADSWLRVIEDRKLLFEGILPAGAAKEWSGDGPFQLKIGNVRVVQVSWNEQPVELLTASGDDIHDLQIPPKK